MTADTNSEQLTLDELGHQADVAPGAGPTVDTADVPNPKRAQCQLGNHVAWFERRDRILKAHGLWDEYGDRERIVVTENGDHVPLAVLRERARQAHDDAELDDVTDDDDRRETQHPTPDP